MLCLALLVGVVQAAPVVWTMSGVTFDDGGTATGSLTYDADSNVYSDWSISVSGGTLAAPGGLPDMTYAVGNAQISNAAATGLLLIDFNVGRVLRMNWSGALTNGGGTSFLATGDFNFATGAYECGNFNCSPVRTMTSGVLVGGTVPEPSTLLLAGAALLGVATGRRRRPASRPV